MQVAEILSDLTSLQVCDHRDALALVTVNERIPLHQTTTTSEDQNQRNTRNSDKDVQRAKELVGLHHALKTRHVNGSVDAADEDLARAREDVGRVLRELSMR